MIHTHISRNIHVSTLAVHRLKYIDVGKVEPEFVTVTSNLAQGRDAQQRRAVNGVGLPLVDTVKCGRNLRNTIKPAQPPGRDQDAVRIDKANHCAYFRFVLEALAVLEHTRKQLMGYGRVLIEEQQPG